MKRRARKHRRGELDGRQEMELLIGPGSRSAFESPFTRRAAWLENREALGALVGEGTRPWGWWQFDAPEPKRVVDKRILLEPTTGEPAMIVSSDGFVTRTRHDGVLKTHESDETYLARLGLLTREERAMRVWARRGARNPSSSEATA